MKKSAKLVMLAVLTLVLAVPTMAVSQDKAQATKSEATAAAKGLRVFFASHSLMWYVPTPLGELAKTAGINDHKLVGLQSLGGSKTQQHWDMAEAKNEAKKALKTGEVDVFVMSPIQFPDQGIENFVKLGLEHNPNMRFSVQVSWGAWDADMQTFPKGGSAGNVDRNKTPDQLKKIHEINIKAAEDQADDINKKHGKGKKILFLVPSAQASITLRTKIFNKEMPGVATQAELFRDAISHPTAPLEALNTYLHFAAIYRQSPVGLPTSSLLKKGKKYDDKTDRALQEMAWETIIKYPYSGVTGKPGDQTVVPPQTDKKDNLPPQQDKKDNPPTKKSIGGFPGGGLPGKGFPGFPGGLPGKGAATPVVGNVLSQAAQEKLKLTEQQQRQIQELQRVMELTLQGILTEDQRKALEEMKKK